MKILVTGAEGFIGRNLVKRLEEEGHFVVGVGRGEGSCKNWKKLDLCDAGSLKGITRGINKIIHLAGVLNVNKSLEAPSETIQNNVLSTLHLLEEIRKESPNSEIISSSSDKVYGGTIKKKVKEEDSCVTSDPYGCSKIMCEQMILNYSRVYGIPYTIIRSGNVFGIGQSGGLFIPSILEKIEKGEEIIWTGNQESRRNFVYVNDLIEAYLLLLKNKKNNSIYNTSSYSIQMKDVTESISNCIKELTQKKILFKIDPKKSRPSKIEGNGFKMSTVKIEKELGWKPKYSFDLAMRETIEGFL